MTNRLLRFLGFDSESYIPEAVEEKTESATHYGTPRHSGRYPWGSGDNPYQHSSYFLSEYNRMRKEGLSEKEIAEAMNMSTGELRSKVTISNEQVKGQNRRQAKQMYDHGYSKSAIAAKMGVSEGTIRNYLNDMPEKQKKTTTSEWSLYLKDQVAEKGMIDVGTGVERELGISDVQLNAAVQILKDEGYSVETINVEQATNPGKYTNIKVLAKPGTTKGDIYRHSDSIKSIRDYDSFSKSEDPHPGFERGRYGLYKPTSIDSNRIQIQYGETGVANDGVIFIRRGVEDLSLGKSNYAQVRIAVDGKHYLKGMAMYNDDMPDGVDVIFNTNKPEGTPPAKVFKPLKKLKDKDGNDTDEIDWDNPFGAAIKSIDKGGQRFYEDDKGKEQLSAINIVNSEGDWGEWSKTLSSQFLSKQNKPLVEKQLDLTYRDKVDQYRDICAITNPTIKQKMLNDFADDCDASAVHLKAIALPGQASHVILPVPDIPENEIYAPKYQNGQMVALIRYPHAGTFEIPMLKVNNNHPTASKLLGQATDAVGISHSTAEQLSGADFDGDTVMVIPASKGYLGTKIKAEPYLDGLKNFSTDIYAIKDENDPLYFCDDAHGFHKQAEMGKVSNLITDMTLLGASKDEIERAVKHSMVVIDAPKHHLDWRASYIENGIAELKEKYQGGKNRGASTIISRASSDYRLPKQKTAYTDYLKDENGSYILDEDGKKIRDPNVSNGINVISGEKVTKDSGETYHKPIYEYEYVTDDNGNRVKRKVMETVISPRTGKEISRPKIVGYEEKETVRTEKTAKMSTEALLDAYGSNDAFNLVSSANTPVERAYANYANQLKALANTARKEMMATQPTKYSASAKDTYRVEVKSLNDKLNVALMNAPRERQAQLAADVIFKLKMEDNPTMDKAEQKKVKAQALAEQRVRYGAKKTRIEISDKEWEAIQAGAITTNKLKQILDNTDMDKLRERAIPRDNTELSVAQKARIENLANNNYTQAEIASMLGISASSVAKYLKS